MKSFNNTIKTKMEFKDFGEPEVSLQIKKPNK